MASNLDPENSTKSSVQKNLPPNGLQSAARCCAIVDLGHHKRIFKGQQAVNQKTGQPLGPAIKVMAIFEFVKYMTTYNEEQGAVPYLIQQEYTFSVDKKAALPDVLKSWGSMPKRPEKIDLRPFVGKLALITIEHSADGKHANIASKGQGINAWNKEFPVTKAHYFYTPPKEKGQPAQQNGIFFELANFDPAIFEQLPPYTKKRISESSEWAAILAKYPQCAIIPQQDNNNAPVVQETGFNETEIQPLDMDDNSPF